MLLNLSSLCYRSFFIFGDIFQNGFQNFENFSLVILVTKILIKMVIPAVFPRTNDKPPLDSQGRTKRTTLDRRVDRASLKEAAWSI